MSGFAAMRAVSDAAKQTEEARAQIQQLQESLKKDQNELARRTKIEQSYPQIAKQRSAEVAAARKATADAAARAKAAREKGNSLSSKLSSLKATNEEELSPYRQLMESTKGRADDAARALAEVRRTLKMAENQANDAVKRRDQRIAAANRTLDSAQERLRKVQSELDRLQKNPTASINALSKMRSEVAAEHAHIDSAKQDIQTVTTDAQRAVDNAQTHLWAQKQSLESAERQADETKKEADAKRNEYDRLYKKATAQESALSQQISACETAAKAAEGETEEAKAKANDAAAVLKDANEVHSTPQATTELQGRIKKTRDEITRQSAVADKLSAREQALREATRKQRLIFIAIVAAVIIVVVLIVFFVLRP
jgi:chromosome segregation ATPase